MRIQGWGVQEKGGNLGVLGWWETQVWGLGIQGWRHRNGDTGGDTGVGGTGTTVGAVGDKVRGHRAGPGGLQAAAGESLCGVRGTFWR